MTTRASKNGLIYPARYFSASPTHFAWNALTAHDVHHHLQFQPGFEGQSLFFILNHPIKFVRIVGLVVDIELTGQGKYLLLTVDDGSGSTLECKVEVRQPGKEGDKVRQEWPSTTLVDNLDVRAELGVPTVEVDRTKVDIGTIVKAKGTIDTFREQRQLKLERIRIVRDTNEEAKAWREAAAWKAEKLSQPWVLSEEDKAEIDRKLAREKALEAEKVKKRRVMDATYVEKKRRHELKKEEIRVILEGTFDCGALNRSGILPDRVTDS